MTTLYPYQQWQDIKQDPGTDLLPFSQWYDSVPVSGACYNQLFGKGNYTAADPSLEGHWELQDDAASTTVVDRSGNAKNGTLVGAGNTSASTTTGPVSWLPKALTFDGTDDRVSISDDADFDITGSLTLLGRFKGTASPTQNEGIVSKYIGSGNQRSYLMHRKASTREVSCSLSDTGLYVADGDASGSTQTVNGTWYSGAVVYNGSTSKIYVDGGLETTDSSVPSSIYSGSADVWIGAQFDSTNPDAHFYGDICDVAILSRELSATEVAEWNAGPEPYNQSLPTITGTPTRGLKITLNAGTWNSQSNGTINYTYELYSYSDTAGAGETLEKRITTTLTSQEVILRGSALVGRYLRLVVTASNDGGFDPAETYTTAYTAAVGSGSDPSHESYNALFGRGKHLEDINLEAHWELQDDAASTVVVDSSLNGRNGTLVNGGNTSARTTTGPTSFLPKALNFDLTTDYVSLPAAALPSGTESSMSCLQRFRTPAAPYLTDSLRMSFGTTGVRCYLGHSSSGAFYWRIGNDIDRTGSTLSVSTWYDAAVTYNGATDSIKGYLNGSLEGSSTNTRPDVPANLRIGAYGGGGNDWMGWVSETATFSKEVSSTEYQQWVDGPEPLNITAASISGPTLVGQTLTASGMTWDNQDNGSVTTSYQWYRADDQSGTNLTAIGGATASTYVLTATEAGKYITVRVRGTNDGGYDDAEDTYSAYTESILTLSDLALTDLSMMAIAGQYHEFLDKQGGIDGCNYNNFLHSIIGSG